MRRSAFLVSVLVLGCGCGTENDEGPLIQWAGEDAPDVSTSIPDDAAVSLPSLTVPGRPDGSLALASMSIDVKVFGRLARTEVTQVFQSHLPSQTEGVYEMTLPEGAVISRLAMDVEGVMTEGELVEKERARAVYEQIVRSQKDPALLEWQGGNRFTMQVFPIPANGTKTIILAYEQVLPLQGKRTEYSYALPSTGTSSIGQFMFHLEAAHTAPPVVEGYEAAVTTSTAHASIAKLVPHGPLRVSFARPAAGSAPLVLMGAKEDERMFLVDVLPDLPAARGGAAKDVVIAIDTSRGIGNKELARAIAVAKGVVSGVKSRGRAARVVHGDLVAKACDSSLDACFAAIEKAGAGGATNLEALLVTAARAAQDLDNPAIVLLSDGTASVGELDGDVLRGRFITALREVNASATVFTIALGHAPDTSFLQTLAGQGRGHALRMTPASSVPGTVESLLHALQVPMFSDVKVTVIEGDVTSLAVLPSFAAAEAGTHLRPGEPLALVGRSAGGAPVTLEMRGRWAGDDVVQRISIPAASSVAGNDIPLVMRMWARGYVASLERAGVPRAETVAASLRYGVMSKATSFLVLENDAAYQRFQVERRRNDERERARERAERERADATPVEATNLEKSKESLALRMAKDAKPARAAQPEEDAAVWAAEPAEAVPDDVVAGKLRALFTSDLASDAKSDSARGGGGPDSDRDRDGDRDKGVKASKKGAPAPLAEREAARESTMQALEGLRVPGLIGNAPMTESLSSLAAAPPRDEDRALRPKVITKSLGSPSVAGALDASVIRRVIMQHLGEVQYCAEKQQLRSASRVSGRLLVKLVINGDGRVTVAQAQQGTTTNSPELIECVLRRVKAWRFPKPEGGGVVTVTYPFAFLDDGPGSFTTSPGFSSVVDAEDKKYFEEQLAKGTISPIDRGALVWLRLNAGETKRAEELFRQSARIAWTEPTPAQAMLNAAVSTPRLRTHFAAELAVAAMAALDEPEPANHTDEARTAALLVGLQRASLVPKVFGTRKMSAEMAGGVLNALREGNAIEEASALFAAWRNADWSDAQLWAALTSSRDVENAVSRWMSAETTATGLALMRATPPATPIDEATFRTWLTAATSGDPPTIARYVNETCRLPNAPVRACHAAVKGNTQLDPDGSLQRFLSPKLLDATIVARRENIADDALLMEEVALREAEGDALGALRTLSEMVEVDPHDVAIRFLYATRLVEKRSLRAACEAYGHTTQLAPSRRELFKTMMSLRRLAAKDALGARDVRQCIVNAVSRLPVQRDVSLVLTWEDPSADVDLHVEGPDGEVVFFQHQSGKDGGLLYYDVTDGFGPEVYTLGDRARAADGKGAGAYRIGVVYYRGSAPLDATLTILENVGTPAETRREVPVHLKSADKDNRISIAEIN